MEINQALNRETIVTHLNVNTKDEVFDAMSELLLQAGVVSDKEGFIRDVYVRESQGATGIGDYIAIPHGKSESVVTPGVAVAVLDHEIEWETLDGEGVRAVILFAVGADNEAAMEHLKLLAMFSKRLGDEAVLDRLLGADTVEDVLNAFEESGDEEEAGEEEEELELDDLMVC